MTAVMLCKNDVARFLTEANGQPVFVSGKLDGVRTLATVDEDGSVKYMSRNGKEFKNFGVFDNELRELAKSAVDCFGFGYPVEFDGEVMDKDGKFSNVMTQVHRIKNVDANILRFKVFDIVSFFDFHNRYYILQSLFDRTRTERVELVIHTVVQPVIMTENNIKALMENFVAQGYEGIVLKLADSSYVGGKSVAWCKVKPKETVDLKVMKVVIGGGKHAGKMGALICDFNGVEVSVGSGFSDEDRLEFMTNTPEIIEVAYQEVLKSGSLRFPTFVRVRDDKDEVTEKAA